jgi:hypothetical protein
MRFVIRFPANLALPFPFPFPFPFQVRLNWKGSRHHASDATRRICKLDARAAAEHDAGLAFELIETHYLESKNLRAKTILVFSKFTPGPGQKGLLELMGMELVEKKT